MLINGVYDGSTMSDFSREVCSDVRTIRLNGSPTFGHISISANTDFSYSHDYGGTDHSGTANSFHPDIGDEATYFEITLLNDTTFDIFYYTG